MQLIKPTKITILGRFWDSQIYDGRLYLFDLDGALQVVEWRSLINSLSVPDNCQIALKIAFLKSEYFEGDMWRNMPGDPDAIALFSRKFDELSRLNLFVDSTQLNKHVVQALSTPFPFAHNDSLIYKNQFYTSSQSGVFVREFEKNEFISNFKVEKLWDAPVASMDLALDMLALAAGDEGLFRTPVANNSSQLSNLPNQPQKIWADLCNDCSYVSNSVLSFGFDVGTKLFEYQKPKTGGRKQQSVINEYMRAQPVRTLEGPDIFGESTVGGFAWGSHHRMCLAKDGYIHVFRYESATATKQSVIRLIDKIQLAPWKGSPVSGDNAIFGSILELDNCIIVVRSDGEVETLRGEPTNWRVFPRSAHYKNQLHVIYDDRIEILSYNHDYAVAQQNKVFGELRY